MEELTVHGYASVFRVRDAVGHVVAPGAFADVVARVQRIPLYWNHSHLIDAPYSPHLPIGVTSELREDSYGLYYKGYLFDTSGARAAHAAIDSGAVWRSSIGFRSKSTEKVRRKGVVHLVRIPNLEEISAVQWAANPFANVRTLRSDDPNPTALRNETAVRAHLLRQIEKEIAA